MKNLNFRKTILLSFKSAFVSNGLMNQWSVTSGKITNYKTKILLLLLALTGISFGVEGQNIFPDSGYAGIGTTNPAKNLHITDSKEDYVALIENLGVGTTKSGLLIKTKSSWTSSVPLKITSSAYDKEIFQVGTNQVRIGEGIIEQNDARLHISGVGMSPKPMMNITDANENTMFNVSYDGDVGIGTNSPSAKLHINSSADVGAGQNPALLIGNRTGLHIGIDNNEIGAFNNNSHAPLHINGSNSNSNTTINGSGTGNVGIGTTNPGSWKLAVNGKIRAKEIKVETGWADFVFYDDYELPTLEEVEMQIEEKGHLKDIPSEKEVEENGILLGEMNAKLLQKIEELTLYTIQQQKEIEDLKSLTKELLKSEK